MSISTKKISKALEKQIDFDAINARGDWLLDVDGTEYEVRVRRARNQVRYEVFSDDFRICSFRLIMQEV